LKFSENKTTTTPPPHNQIRKALVVEEKLESNRIKYSESQYIIILIYQLIGKRIIHLINGVNTWVIHLKTRTKTGPLSRPIY
jgi:hypothetical protein